MSLYVVYDTLNEFNVRIHQRDTVVIVPLMSLRRQIFARRCKKYTFTSLSTGLGNIGFENTDPNSIQFKCLDVHNSNRTSIYPNHVLI